MAILSDTARQAAWAEFMAVLSKTNEELANLTKADLRATLDAIDVWMDSNAGDLHAAIPQPARSNLTVPQKAQLLNFVVRWRYMKET